MADPEQPPPARSQVGSPTASSAQGQQDPSPPYTLNAYLHDTSSITDLIAHGEVGSRPDHIARAAEAISKFNTKYGGH
ncbi:hypothetical protein IFR04_015746 [Cadophora malorum]|uniref:Uncharacterized protein n=1 Tax=Cadophora malorum TaxID=108018 RepID=A0A8H7T149_9HELO|nr:hypothetical protein IFR04_015746 [Cadophora malorum]